MTIKYESHSSSNQVNRTDSLKYNPSSNATTQIATIFITRLNSVESIVALYLNINNSILVLRLNINAGCKEEIWVRNESFCE